MWVLVSPQKFKFLLLPDAFDTRTEKREDEYIEKEISIRCFQKWFEQIYSWV